MKTKQKPRTAYFSETIFGIKSPLVTTMTASFGKHWKILTYSVDRLWQSEDGTPLALIRKKGAPKKSAIMIQGNWDGFESLIIR